MTGLRSTKQRTAVSNLLDQLDDFRSAQELHEELRRRGEGIGLTTVYRTLQSLADAGQVDVLRTDSGEAIYRRCSAHHHHHLVCRHCGRTVEVEGPAWRSGLTVSRPRTASPRSATPSRSSARARSARPRTPRSFAAASWSGRPGRRGAPTAPRRGRRRDRPGPLAPVRGRPTASRALVRWFATRRPC